MQVPDSEDFNYADYDLKELVNLAGQISYGQFQIHFHEEVLRRIYLEQPDNEELINAFKLQLVDSLTMSGQLHRIPPLFTEIEAFVESQLQEDLAPEFLHSFGWQFRNYLDALRDDPQVSAAELYSALDRMHAFYVLNNDQMKSYYLRAYYIHKDLGDESQAAEFRELWLNAPHSEFSDCAGCDPTHVVWMHTRIGDWEQAVKIGEQALANEEVDCGAQPENLELALLEAWLRTGDFEAAAEGNGSAFLRNCEDVMYLEHFAPHFRYFALIGPGQPKKLQVGLELFTAFAHNYDKAESPKALMQLCSASALLLSTAAATLGAKAPKQLPVTLPGENLPWVSAPTLHNPTLAEAQQWCAGIAMDLAAQFDHRPGIKRSHFVAEIDRELNKTQPLSNIPKAGLWDMLYDEIQREILRNGSPKRLLIRLFFRSLPVAIVDLFRYRTPKSPTARS